MKRAQPSLAATLSLTFALCFSGAAMAEPLYLGEEERNTGDRAVMATIMEHCTGLQQEEAEAPKTAESQREEDR